MSPARNSTDLRSKHSASFRPWRGGRRGAVALSLLMLGVPVAVIAAAGDGTPFPVGGQPEAVSQPAARFEAFRPPGGSNPYGRLKETEALYSAAADRADRDSGTVGPVQPRQGRTPPGSRGYGVRRYFASMLQGKGPGSDIPEHGAATERSGPFLGSQAAKAPAGYLSFGQWGEQDLAAVSAYAHLDGETGWRVQWYQANCEVAVQASARVNELKDDVPFSANNPLVVSTGAGSSLTAGIPGGLHTQVDFSSGAVHDFILTVAGAGGSGAPITGAGGTWSVWVPSGGGGSGSFFGPAGEEISGVWGIWSGAFSGKR